MKKITVTQKSFTKNMDYHIIRQGLSSKTENPESTENRGKGLVASSNKIGDANE